jgi:predicted ribonuclease toxin of YeeF-YezG toxin-antitoxin module
MEVSRIKAKHNYELTKDYYLELKEFRNDNAKTENLNICHPYAIETGACSETNKIKELILRKVYNEIMATENRKKAFKYVKDKLAKEKEEEEEQNNFSPEKR